MFFSFTITTPASTLDPSPKVTVLPLDSGQIRRLIISFPPGPAGLLHLELYHVGHKLWPTNPDELFNFDGTSFAWEEQLDFLEPPYELLAYTYNLDDTFAHDVDVGIEILEPDKLATQAGLATGLLSFLRLVFGR